MEKIVNGMGKIEFGKFYNSKNKIISSLDESPILNNQKVKNISLNQLKKLLDNEYIYIIFYLIEIKFLYIELILLIYYLNIDLTYL